ncbi:MAG: DDE-type integrase/transposase/recombinase [Rhizobiaceae bacterium]|nr:DDE-type integrase/transposase/recombinase [Rhizobiaceae bacterium]
MTAMRVPSETSPARGRDGEWLTAREIAAECLPDIPSTERGVQLIAERNGWDGTSLARKRGGRGGATEYHVSLLPLLAQVAFTQKRMRVDMPEPALPETPATPSLSAPSLSARAQLARDARLAIVAAFDRFSRSVQLNFATRVQIFVDKYNAGSLAVDEWVREAVPSLSKRTLMRFRAKKRAGGTEALAHDPAQSRKGTGILDQANGGRVRAFMLGLIAHQPHLSADAVRVQCRAEFGDIVHVVLKGEKTYIELPPVRTFQHVLKRLKEEHRVELIKLTNPDQYRSTLALSGVGTLRHVTEPNQLWQIDASPVDALCVDGRHSIYGCIDIATRRTVWLVSRTPRASAVALLLRKAVLEWGVPDMVVTDNGSDFVALETKRLFASLGIDPDTSNAYSPEEKGHVERVIRTFQHQVGPLLPGYVGHSVADRKAIENRKSFAKRLGETEAETFGVTLTGAKLQAHVDGWARDIYQHRPHGGLNKETPHQMALRSTAAIRRVDERALDVLLMPVVGQNGQRTVTKFGIRNDHRFYLAPTLLPGTVVFARQDPNDAGRIYAFTEDGATFLAEAICPELSGLHPETLVKAAKEIHRELLDERTREMKAEMKRIAKGAPLIERALDVAQRDAEKRAAEAGNVIALPKREETHSTPQIAAAIEAMSERRIETRALSAREEAEQLRIIAEMDAASVTRIHEDAEAVAAARVAAIETARTAHLPKGANIVALPETPKERYRRAVLFEAQLQADTLCAADAVWLGGYRKSAEYSAHKGMHEEFGDTWLEP